MHDTPLSRLDFFSVPPQTLRGHRDDMLAEIDRAITGLLVLRKLIGGGEPHLRTGDPGCRPAMPRRARTPDWIRAVWTRISRD